MLEFYLSCLIRSSFLLIVFQWIPITHLWSQSHILSGIQRETNKQGNETWYALVKKKKPKKLSGNPGRANLSDCIFIAQRVVVIIRKGRQTCLFPVCSGAEQASVSYSIIQSEKVDFNQIQYRLGVAVCRLQMCVCFSESAWRLAFSWAPHRVLGNKYGNLSMRASLLSACFCLLLGLVKYHFSINTLMSNSTRGSAAADDCIRGGVNLKNVFTS